MKHKTLIVMAGIIFFLCGCTKAGAESTEEYKNELMGKYPPYDFECAEFVCLSYPTLDELIERAESSVSFIVADEVIPLDPISFKYESTKADTGTAAIEEKMKKQGMNPGTGTIIYPYEIDVSSVYGSKTVEGKTVFFISQYFSAVPEADSAMGLLVSGGADVPSAWKEAYEKAYPAADTYVCLLHPELSYYYISDDDIVIPMCAHNKEEYDLLTGLTLKEFEKMLK